MEKGKKKSKNTYQRIQKIWSHPTTLATGLFVLYLTADATLLNTSRAPDGKYTVIYLGLALGLFFTAYVLPYWNGKRRRATKDIPSGIKNKKRFVTVTYFITAAIAITASMLYHQMGDDLLPSLSSTYYESQVNVLVLVAPIMEELIFRYVLYDMWARARFGKVKGILLSGAIFVVCHPVTGLEGLVLYWIPTILFYVIYEEFGLYGSILSHAIFNFIAL